MVRARSVLIIFCQACLVASNDISMPVEQGAVAGDAKLRGLAESTFAEADEERIKLLPEAWQRVVREKPEILQQLNMIPVNMLKQFLANPSTIPPGVVTLLNSMGLSLDALTNKTTSPGSNNTTTSVAAETTTTIAETTTIIVEEISSATGRSRLHFLGVFMCLVACLFQLVAADDTLSNQTLDANSNKLAESTDAVPHADDGLEARLALLPESWREVIRSNPEYRAQIAALPIQLIEQMVRDPRSIPPEMLAMIPEELNITELIANAPNATGSLSTTPKPEENSSAGWHRAQFLSVLIGLLAGLYQLVAAEM